MKHLAAWLLLSLMTASIATADTIKVAHNRLLPPFAEVKDGKTVGLLIDIFRAAAERAGYQVEFFPVPLEQMEASLKDGSAIATIPTAITPERRQTMDFTDMLLMTGGSISVRAGEAAPDNLQALAGKVVVTPRTGPLAAFIGKTAPAVKLEVTEDYETSLERLVGGKADAAALNVQAGAMIANKLYPGKVTVAQKMFLELPFSAAVLKGQNAEFVTRFNKGLADIRADGTFERINKSWLGQ
ncbi:MAG: transporter substrate-binding domain-containing protein [Pseudorhodoplanes sp.]